MPHNTTGQAMNTNIYILTLFNMEMYKLYQIKLPLVSIRLSISTVNKFPKSLRTTKAGKTK